MSLIMESLCPDVLAWQGIKGMQSVILPPEGKNYSDLWYSWHFLQDYSNWGLRQPCTVDSLKSELSISNTKKYPFFYLMLSGNIQIKNLCDLFKTKIFPEVITITRSILKFARTSSPAGENFFGLIVQMIEQKNFNDALEVLRELRELSQNNLEEAKIGETNLGNFYSDLISAQSTFKRCQFELEKNSITSKDIDYIPGEVTRGLAYSAKKITKLVKDAPFAHMYNPSIAPFGILVPPTVPNFTWFNGSKQNEEDRVELKIKKASQENLKKAEQKLNFILEATKQGINHNEVLKKSWIDIVKNLEDISIKVSSMIRKTDEGEILKIKIIVLPYIYEAEKAWSSLIQPLTDLLDAFQIKVEEDTKSTSKLANDN